jgi:hypothetical protein
MAHIISAGKVIVSFEGDGPIRHGATPEGQSVYLNLEGVNPNYHFQRAVLRSEAFKGKPGLGRRTEEGLRIIDVSRRTGAGTQILPDGRHITLQLSEGFPIKRQSRGLER